MNKNQQTLPCVQDGLSHYGSDKQHLALTLLMQGLLRQLDPESTREGLAETPERAAKAWQDWTAGYTMDAASILKVFEDGAEGCDEMVVVEDIPVYSHCEHHLAPIFGFATVGYLPDGKIVGLSKLNRLVDMHARRLQVQERMTNDIAKDLMEHLKPKGVGVVIKARHMCMESRGVKQCGSATTTSAMLGLFRTDPAVRSEFLALTR
jgi:GTP cyclohydrolase I